MRSRLRPRRLLGVLVPTTLLSAIVSLLPATRAAGLADYCSYGGGTLFVSWPVAERATLFLDAAESYMLSFAGMEDGCNGATRSNTDSIQVSGDNNENVFVLRQNGPGGSVPGDLGGEIDLLDGDDTFCIVGRSRRDRVLFGRFTAGPDTFRVVDLNADGEPNFDLFDVEHGGAKVRGGRDFVSGAPGGPYRPFNLPLLLKGGGGNDRLTGGNKDDRELGNTGDDHLQGKAGDDFLKGGPGDDDCDGGAGQDTERGCESGSRY